MNRRLVNGRLALVLIVLIAALDVRAQGSTELPADQGPWVVRAWYENDSALKLLQRRAAPWKVDRKARTLLLDVPNRFEYQQLLKDGFRAEIDPALTRAVFSPNERLPGQFSGIAGYPCYRTIDESYARAARLATRFPNLVQIVDIGDSWEKTQGLGGYDLRVVKLGNRSIGGVRPQFFLQGALHAREYATTETVTRFMEQLLQGYGQDADSTWLLDHQDTHLLLVANPDGRRFAEMPATRPQRKNRNAEHCAAGGVLLGVDLNRNFPFDWGGLGSSDQPCENVYRGPARSSEPEIQAISQYLAQIFPDQRAEIPIPAIDLTTPISTDAMGIFIDLHSPAAAVWWPWGNVENQLAPNALELQTLGRKLAFYNGYLPQQSSEGGAIAGASDDFVFGTLGVASYTVEMGGDGFFPSCDGYEFELVEPNLAALKVAAKMARAPYRLAAGPEMVELSAPETPVSAGRFRLQATADDRRFSFVNGVEPVQTISDAHVYRDLPWLSGAEPIAHMVFSDGIPNGLIEQMEASIEVTTLTPGRQLLYVRARDTAGNWGAPSAVFVTRGENPVFYDGFE